MDNDLVLVDDKYVNKSFVESFVKAIFFDLNDIKHAFIRIGFRLNEARNLKYYKVFGFDNIESLAESMFGFKRSTTYGLIKVWSCFHDKERIMFLNPTFKDFNYSQLLELSKAKSNIVSLSSCVNPSSSVKDISHYVKSYNRYLDTAILPVSVKEFDTNYKQDNNYYLKEVDKSTLSEEKTQVTVINPVQISGQNEVLGFIPSMEVFTYDCRVLDKFSRELYNLYFDNPDFDNAWNSSDFDKLADYVKNFRLAIIEVKLRSHNILKIIKENLGIDFGKIV